MSRFIRRMSGTTLALIILFLITIFASWVTHIVVCLKTAAWGFLIAGAIFAPLGMIHGFGYWFGAW